MRIPCRLYFALLLFTIPVAVNAGFGCIEFSGFELKASEYHTPDVTAYRFDTSSCAEGSEAYMSLDNPSRPEKMRIHCTNSEGVSIVEEQPVPHYYLHDSYSISEYFCGSVWCAKLCILMYYFPFISSALCDQRVSISSKSLLDGTETEKKLITKAVVYDFDREIESLVPWKIMEPSADFFGKEEFVRYAKGSFNKFFPDDRLNKDAEMEFIAVSAFYCATFPTEYLKICNESIVKIFIDSVPEENLSRSEVINELYRVTLNPPAYCKEINGVNVFRFLLDGTCYESISQETSEIPCVDLDKEWRLQPIPLLEFLKEGDQMMVERVLGRIKGNKIEAYKIENNKQGSCL